MKFLTITVASAALALVSCGSHCRHSKHGKHGHHGKHGYHHGSKTDHHKGALVKLPCPGKISQ